MHLLMILCVCFGSLITEVIVVVGDVLKKGCMEKSFHKMSRFDSSREVEKILPCLFFHLITTPQNFSDKYTQQLREAEMPRWDFIALQTNISNSYIYSRIPI